MFQINYRCSSALRRSAHFHCVYSMSVEKLLLSNNFFFKASCGSECWTCLLWRSDRGHMLGKPCVIGKTAFADRRLCSDPQTCLWVWGWRQLVRKRRLWLKPQSDFCFSPLIRPERRVKLSGDLLVIKLNVTKLIAPEDQVSKQVQHDWQVVREMPACRRSHAVQRRGLISHNGEAGLCGSPQWEHHERILKY